MPPVPDYHTGGFVIYRQTYFRKSEMSRSSYAGLCAGTTLWENRGFYWKTSGFIPPDSYRDS